MAEFADNMGCVPLAERTLRIPDKRKALLCRFDYGAGCCRYRGRCDAAGDCVSVRCAGDHTLQIVPLRSLYQVIDWPVIVLLAALIPVAGAMQHRRGGSNSARHSGKFRARPCNHRLGAILVVTTTLSDLMNNAATAAVMRPIALGAAHQLSANPDAFLMAAMGVMRIPDADWPSE